MVEGTCFPQLPRSVTSTVDHPLRSPSARPIWRSDTLNLKPLTLLLWCVVSQPQVSLFLSYPRSILLITLSSYYDNHAYAGLLILILLPQVLLLSLLPSYDTIAPPRQQLCFIGWTRSLEKLPYESVIARWNKVVIGVANVLPTVSYLKYYYTTIATSNMMIYPPTPSIYFAYY